MVEAELVSWIFAAIMTVGMTFLLLSIFLGDVGDFDADIDIDIDVDLDIDGAMDGIIGEGNVAESRNLGCMVISAFMTGFGSVGLFGRVGRRLF